MGSSIGRLPGRTTQRDRFPERVGDGHSQAATRSRRYYWTATTGRNQFLRRRRSRAFRRVSGSLPGLASDQSRLPVRALRQTRDGRSAPDPPMCRSRLSESTRRRRPRCANRVRRNGRAAHRRRVFLGDRPICRHSSSTLGKFAWAHTFPLRYRQRVQLWQPSEEVPEWLSHRDDVLINRVEIALDCLFNCKAHRDDAWDFLHGHLVRRWHSRSQRIRIIQNDDQEEDGFGTRYDAGRGSPNNIAFYEEGHSRVTGELSCLHLEWRLNQLKAVRTHTHSRRHRIGPHLLDFDWQFWKERLLLVNVNKPRLGRLLNNHKKRKKEPEGEVGTGREELLDRPRSTARRKSCKGSRYGAGISGQSLDPWRFPLIFLSALA
jgi:hypothetical protein